MNNSSAICIEKRWGKPKLDSLTGIQNRKRLIRVALIEHYRGYIGFDFFYLKTIRKNLNKMPHDLVPIIARDYEVIRTLKLGDDEQKRRTLATLLDETAAD